MMDLSTLRISEELIPNWLGISHEKGALSVYDTVRAIIETRRSIREYSERPVTTETLQELIEIANWAPSPENAQNWRIVVVRNPEMLDRIKRFLTIAFDKQIKEKLGKALEEKPKVVSRTRGFFSTLGGAPAMIFVFVVPSGHGVEIDMQSAAAWTQTFLLASHSKGLATCWFAGVLYCEDEIRNELQVSEGRLANGITLGYPSKSRLYVPKRKNYPDALKWID
ncbi:MAG: nitroreductase family protein [Deltaproteobacteria bacterium]|nr:nitroreductase family protein [Deltaproteobacteria bacterium]